MTSPVMFLLALPVASPTQSSSVVVVVAEVGHVVESIRVNIFGPLVVVVPYVVHVLLVEKDVSDREEESIVEDSIKGAQISTEVPHIAIKYFSNCVDSRSLRKLTPKPFWYLWDCIYPQAINVVFFNHVLNPAQKGGSHIVILLLQIC